MVTEGKKVLYDRLSFGLTQITPYIIFLKPFVVRWSSYFR